MTYEGVWIVLDGPDGSGTTTQIFRLAESIFRADKSHLVLMTREPTMGFYGSKIRRMLSDPNIDISATGEEFRDLFILDRKDHMKRVVMPALKQGLIVLQDRSLYSTIAYQGMQGVPLDEIVRKHDFMPTVPDISLIFRVDVHRLKDRLDTSHKEAFDNLDYQAKIMHNYDLLPSLLSSQVPKHNLIYVDANKGIDDLTVECFQHIKPFLPMNYERLQQSFR